MKKILFSMLIMASLCQLLGAQHLHRVNNNPGVNDTYTTLQAAVDAATAGDTIFIEGSATEYAGATITKKLTLVGPGFLLGENPKTQACTVEATFNSDISFESGSGGSAIMGCVLNNYDLLINVSDMLIIRNKLYDLNFDSNSNNVLVAQNWIYRIKATNGSITNSIISNNIIRREIEALNTSGPLVVTNNIFLLYESYPNYPIDCHNASIQNNILSALKANIQANTGNDISNNIMAIAGTDADGNLYNIDMNTVFADFSGSLGMSKDGKWKLKDGSPAIGAGSGGVDCGIFGGSSPYVLSGIPDLPHIYDASVPATATSGTGLQVTIYLKSGD